MPPLHARESRLGVRPRRRSAGAGPISSELRPRGAGYRSALRVPIRLDGRFRRGRSSFLSMTPGTYSRGRRADRRGASPTGCRPQPRARARSKALDSAPTKRPPAPRSSKSRVRALTDELDARTGYRRVIGESATWREVLTQATQVAATETTVLLLGESGTGKEVVARFLHRASARAQRAVHRAQLRGPARAAARSGAVRLRARRVHRRDAEQARTARAGGRRHAVSRRSRRDEPVGAGQVPARAAGARVPAARRHARAAHRCARRRRPPTAICSARWSRGSSARISYYRLNVFAIQPAAAARSARRHPAAERGVSRRVRPQRSAARPPASRATRGSGCWTYHWPGNVRELRNILERAAILCDGGLITADHLALIAAPGRAPRPAPRRLRLPSPPGRRIAWPRAKPPRSGDAPTTPSQQRICSPSSAR